MKRLLAIDDSVDMGELIANIAAPLGYACEHVIAFADFKRLLASAPDVVVVDLIMPAVDGIQVLRYLGEQQCRAGILLLSGANLRVLSVAEELARALGLQVLGRLPKPFAREALQAILRRGASTQLPHLVRELAVPAINAENLRAAIAGKQLVLHYHPQVDIKTGVAAGAEALVRWQYPGHGLVFPDAFIAQSESWRLIDDLTWAVVDIAFDDAQTFGARGWKPTLSINVSALSLRDVKLPDKLLARAQAAGIAPTRIVVEITESEMIHKEPAVLDTLARLRLHGFSLSIDDFGAGFSMMHQLKRVPADELKIDREFVRVMAYDQDARIIVRKTIEIGHDMGMKIVAEGVETPQQLQMLGDLGCDFAQGYLFARPMPTVDAVAWQGARALGPEHYSRDHHNYRESAERYRQEQQQCLSEPGLHSVDAAPAAPKTLLIIDDIPEIAGLVSVIARPLGYTCHHAVSFEQFQTLLAMAPALIVVDLVMPNVDGIEVLRYLGEQRCRAGIVLMSRVEWSVLSVAEEMARSTGLKVIGVVRKPFTRRELERILRGEVDAPAPAAPPRRAAPTITEDELRRAIAEHQFVLHYQPRIDIRTGSVSGVEAQLRWLHPLHGRVYPDAFIALAESCGLISALTWLVVDRMFGDLQAFAGLGWQPTLSINVSVYHLKDVELPDLLLARARAAGIAPERIAIEITDSGSIDNVTVALDILARLRLCGFSLSIDDFGAGFSMMHQLKRIPANEIKLDKAFIRTMDRDPDARVIVRKTVEIGQEMGMTVVAKGVETPGQLGMLREMHCELAQGYLFARAMPAADIVAWREAFESKR